MYMRSAAAQIKQRLLFVGREEGKLLAMRQMIADGVSPPVLVRRVSCCARLCELHRALLRGQWWYRCGCTAFALRCLMTPASAHSRLVPATAAFEAHSRWWYRSLVETVCFMGVRFVARGLCRYLCSQKSERKSCTRNWRLTA